MKKHSFYLIVVLLFISCKKEAATTFPPNTFPLTDTIVTNISYGNNDADKLDLGLPANRTNETKLVIVIHGGAWSSGDKGDLNFITSGLKSRGFAVANMNYRLSPQSDDNYSMQLDDIDSAITFLNKNASYYIFKPSQFYITGHSAGAHLSLSYAYTRNSNGKIKAAAGMASPTNLFSAAYYNTVIDAPLITPYLGAPLTIASEQRYKDCSPYYHVNKNTLPTILFQGYLDIIIQREQATSLWSLLTKNGVANKVIIYPLVFHDWWTNGDLVKNTLDEMAAWFNKY
ncbi:MAG: alpha/beta hydrolase [Bacteroidota bacterium]|nr:alpha/beta hydrolase [Bacteroidota bacterium]